MDDERYAAVILEKIDEGPASIGTLKEACGQGNKINSLRKAFYSLIKNNKIEINGYDKHCKSFKFNGIMVKKVDANIKNPIYVKNLLDNPLENENYFEIQQIFRNRIAIVNQIYKDELKELEEIEGEMLLKKAIDLDCVKSVKHPTNVKYPGEKKYETFEDLLEDHPETKIHYLKKSFGSKLVPIFTSDLIKYPYFDGRVSYSSKSSGNKLFWRDSSFVRDYKRYLDHLPLNVFDEEYLFNYFVIGTLKMKGDDPEIKKIDVKTATGNKEKKEDRLWNLAQLLTSNHLNLFVDKLKVIEIIKENATDQVLDGKCLHW